MELKQLRYFVGVSEAGSLLKASSRLHIAQPALGQHIVTLEAELGARLFERSSRGVALTEAGKTFLEHARVVLGDVERARQAVRDTAGIPRGEVALGLPTTVALVSTLPILSACRAQYPEVRLKVVEAYSGFLKEWLLAGRLDLALFFGSKPEPGLAKQALLEDRIVFVTSATGRPGPSKMSLAALADQPLVLPGKEHGLRRIVDEACAPLKLQLDVVAEIESLGSVKRAVEAGIGSTILPQASVTEEVAAGRLRTAVIDSPLMSRRVVCASHTQRPVSSASAAVQALVVEVLRGMVEDGTWPARWVGEVRAQARS
ncbi:transcriptional regulator [Acidovorax sp. CF316]|jgi:LysR family transcriptional regulator, nitrogen assimilation regulatory protein|uniref:LysR substrate-binding domain-containing protein n=1 Tax=Acidovorax sp. CF316 TaxID=1144317 RepID=UPI00026BD806|nr:LysR substrate-binding domain-containing protein [Acidovorax sp. CF316]EJE50616.1 transcriptional regulator [Acidovorax sp. CF316]